MPCKHVHLALGCASCALDNWIACGPPAPAIGGRRPAPTPPPNRCHDPRGYCGEALGLHVPPCPIAVKAADPQWQPGRSSVLTDAELDWITGCAERSKQALADAVEPSRAEIAADVRRSRPTPKAGRLL